MKRLIFNLLGTALLLGIHFNDSLAQFGYIKPLPFRGAPIAMFRTKDKGFITVMDVALKPREFQNGTLIKHNANGDTVKVVRLSPGFASKVAIDQVSLFDSSILFVYAARYDSLARFAYFFDQDLNQIKIIKAKSPYYRLYKTQKNEYRGSEGFNLFSYDSLITKIDSVATATDVRDYTRSNNGLNIFTNGPPNPFFPPSKITYQQFNDSLQLLQTRNYYDTDNIPFPLNNGWLMYYRGLFRMSNNLDSIWHQPPSVYKLPTFPENYTTDIKQLPDGGFIMTGPVRTPGVYETIFLTRTDSLGNVIFKKWIPLNADKVVGVEPLDNGKYMLFAAGYPDSLNRDTLLLIEVNADGTVGNDQDLTQNNKSLKAFPNPFNDAFQILFPELYTGEIKVYDASSKVVYSKRLNYEIQSEINLNGYPPGAYYVYARNQEIKYETIKLIKK